MSIIKKGASGQVALTTIVLLDRASGNKLYLETQVAVNCHTVHSFATLLCIKGAKHFQYDQDRRVVTITFDSVDDFSELEKEVPELLEQERIYTTVRRGRRERIRELASLLWRATVQLMQLLWRLIVWLAQQCVRLGRVILERFER